MIFMGVDQTGAIDSKGRPRPLPSCLLVENSVRFLYLSHLSRTEIEAVISSRQRRSLKIGLDCVLGLPSGIRIRWREALRMTLTHDGFGRTPARNFFKSLGQGKILRREVEKICRATSAFQETPFQRNIQTGTFRLWKDIATNANDFYAPLVEKRVADALPLFEGYPSLAWRQLFHLPSRKPRDLGFHLQQRFPKVRWSIQNEKQVANDPNLADALVLALQLREEILRLRRRRPTHEGWIVGADKLTDWRTREQESEVPLLL